MSLRRVRVSDRGRDNHCHGCRDQARGARRKFFQLPTLFVAISYTAATIFAEHPQKADNECRGTGILHKTPEVEPLEPRLVRRGERRERCSFAESFHSLFSSFVLPHFVNLSKGRSSMCR